MTGNSTPEMLKLISEPTYESVKDKNIVSVVTLGLKKAGFEKGTSYVLTQSDKNELVISITKINGMEVKNTGVIVLQKGIDFIEKNGTTSVTEQGTQKMKDNYEGIKNLLPGRKKIISEIGDQINDIKDEILSA